MSSRWDLGVEIVRNAGAKLTYAQVEITVSFIRQGKRKRT